METDYSWDEAKRRANLRKHGLDFRHASEVLKSRYRLDIEIVRNGELRTQSFSYVTKRLAVLTTVHVDRDGTTRIISFRPASAVEVEVYLEWLETETDEP